jgi:hypothetical protein
MFINIPHIYFHALSEFGFLYAFYIVYLPEYKLPQFRIFCYHKNVYTELYARLKVTPIFEDEKLGGGGGGGILVLYLPKLFNLLFIPN